MTFSKGGTISLGGKTYNISQINSVYIGDVKRYNTITIWSLWFIGGFLSTLILGSVQNQNFSVPLWMLATLAAFITAIMFTTKKDNAVFFDMSSGKVAAFSDRDRTKVVRIKNDIIKGLEEGYFPNYLGGGK